MIALESFPWPLLFRITGRFLQRSNGNAIANLGRPDNDAFTICTFARTFSHQLHGIRAIGRIPRVLPTIPRVNNTEKRITQIRQNHRHTVRFSPDRMSSVFRYVTISYRSFVDYLFITIHNALRSFRCNNDFRLPFAAYYFGAVILRDRRTVVPPLRPPPTV